MSYIYVMYDTNLSYLYGKYDRFTYDLYVLYDAKNGPNSHLSPYASVSYSLMKSVSYEVSLANSLILKERNRQNEGNPSQDAGN